MAFNIPAHDSQNFSFGPGVLFIGPTGATPSIDLGAVRPGSELAVTREIIEVRQGSQQNLIKQYVTQETVQLSVTGIEWDLTRIKDALGSGVLSTVGDVEELGFGGDINITEVALSFRHVLPIGHTVFVDLWRAQGAPEFTLSFAEEIHEFPFTFRALDSTLSWESEDLEPTLKRLFRIRRVT